MTIDNFWQLGATISSPSWNSNSTSVPILQYGISYGISCRCFSSNSEDSEKWVAHLYVSIDGGTPQLIATDSGDYDSNGSVYINSYNIYANSTVQFSCDWTAQWQQSTNPFPTTPTSTSSTPVFSVTGVPHPPSTPTNIVCPSSVMANTNINVTWNASTDQDGDAITYSVDFYDGTSWSNLGTTTNLSMSKTMPNITGTCQFRVCAFDSTYMYSGYGYSNNIYVSNNIPPNAPTSITVPASAAAKSTINVYWDSPNQSIYGKYNITTVTDTVDSYPNTPVTTQIKNSYGGYEENGVNMSTGYSVSNHIATSTGNEIVNGPSGFIGHYIVTSSEVIRIDSYYYDGGELPENTWFRCTIVFQSSSQTSTVKDGYIGDVTAPYNTYPNDGISGSYWYVYKGTSPSVDSDGDTISYKLEFYNGTGWLVCGTTTATNMDYTLPDIEITTAKFRVTATDSRGGTSGTITSNNFTIFKILLYMNIDGQLKRYNKGYVNIDGTLKTISEIWINIDGVLKKI